MRAVVQRVSHAKVVIDGTEKSAINSGLLVFVGIEAEDTEEDIQWIGKKVTQLRVFDDEEKIPNLSLKETGGDLLLVSQFTLYASVKKGNRPSYIRAATPEIAKPLYQKLIVQLQNELGKKIYTGEFGAEMKVHLLNDGPITIWIDSKMKE